VELSAKALIRWFLERVVRDIDVFCRAAGHSGVTKKVNFGTGNRVSRVCSNIPKIAPVLPQLLVVQRSSAARLFPHLPLAPQQVVIVLGEAVCLVADVLQQP
jgi:hypothetical protein